MIRYLPSYRSWLSCRLGVIKTEIVFELIWGKMDLRESNKEEQGRWQWFYLLTYGWRGISWYTTSDNWWYLVENSKVWQGKDTLRVEGSLIRQRRTSLQDILSHNIHMVLIFEAELCCRPLGFECELLR